MHITVLKRIETKAQNDERDKTLYIYIIVCSVCMHTISRYSIINAYIRCSDSKWWKHKKKTQCVHANDYRQKQTNLQTAAHSHRIIYYCTLSISMDFFVCCCFCCWNFAWRIYCHHWNLIVLPLCQWLFNSINIIVAVAATAVVVIVFVAYFIASIEQTVSMLKCTWTRKHQFTASIASNLTCEFFRLHLINFGRNCKRQC